MKSYPGFIEGIFRADHLLEKLTPSEPLDWDLARKTREADDATLLGDRTPVSPSHATLVRGGLLYALDELDRAHTVFQEDRSDLGSYWHGMMHRREGDFDNARYWFRRAGSQPFFAALHGSASEVSADMAKQPGWDPYLFTGQCEQARHGDTDLIPELVKLQRLEFEAIFDYFWQKAVRSAE